MREKDIADLSLCLAFSFLVTLLFPEQKAREMMGDIIKEKAMELWKAEYEKRLEQDLKVGQIELPNPEDRRKIPRLMLQRGKNIWIHTGRLAVPILNISTGGVAFYSEHRFFPGDNIFLSVANTLSIEAVVLDCIIEESDPVFMEYRYKVRVRYADGENGYKIYVLARDIYIHNLEKPFETYVVN